MSSIIVKKDLNFQELENILSNILVEKEDIKLRIPKTLKFSGGLGIEVSLIQIIITCFRLSTSNILHTYYNNIGTEDDKTYLEKFNARLFGICALTMANQIVDNQSNILKKSFSLTPAIPYIEAMDKCDYPNTTKGKEVNLVSISGVKNEYISSLYNLGNKDNLKSSLEFKIQIEKIMKYLFRFTYLSKREEIKTKINDNYLDSISLLVHELFINTHEHARTNFNGDKYTRTMSGIKYAFSDYEKDQITDLFNLNMDIYTDFLKNNYRSADKITIFEISIFDSGPGYARRWLKKDFKDFTLEEEQKAFEFCLEKHSTTKPGNQSGMGLSIVRNMLKNLNGYIRIRSGRLCFDEFNIEKKTISKFNKKELGQVEGTAISICIPF
jgi:hypothetical protein